MPTREVSSRSPAPAGPPTVLFVCTGNAGRSQMAEATFRHRVGERVRLVSAGVDPWPDLHPMARRLMEERGLDLAGHYPKSVARAIELLVESETAADASRAAGCDTAPPPMPVGAPWSTGRLRDAPGL
ncbi:low molecular weight phosphatase family protein [Candidatus Latescibacterota bacterium]